MLSHGKRVGDRIGPYRLTGVLGSGGAGQVFRAKWVPSEAERIVGGDDHPEEVAVKLMRPDMVANEGLFKRFVREIGVAQTIHHPHIIQHVDSGLAGEFLYYAMELVPYGSLRDVLAKRGALPWRDGVEAAMHIADALSALHEAGVLHRDLKPENVFLSEDGALKLGDFGLARKEDGPQLTVSGQTVGSVRYMSPEQVCGRSDLDGRCDLYSLGCLMMEVLSGKAPFEDGDTMALFYQHVEEPPPKLRSRVPDAPKTLEELVDRLLEKDRGDRPASAQVTRDILGELLASTTGEIGPLAPRLGHATAAEIEPLPDNESDGGALYHDEVKSASLSGESFASRDSFVLDRDLADYSYNGPIPKGDTQEAVAETVETTRELPTRKGTTRGAAEIPRTAGLAQRLAEPKTKAGDLLSPTAWIVLAVGVVVIAGLAAFGGQLLDSDGGRSRPRSNTTIIYSPR